MLIIVNIAVYDLLIIIVINEFLHLLIPFYFKTFNCSLPFRNWPKSSKS